eukprot:GDKJ01020983.1.p1 GENE.GDKJ01020983.1~~GDKJ01020983.1.p1  ORF type:complete len:156 (+),score=21.81 GDKJ01020983.1:38-505(+)
MLRQYFSNSSRMIWRNFSIAAINTSTSAPDVLIPRKRVRGVKKQIFSLTQAAADRVQFLMSQKENAKEIVGVKVGLKKKGCNGLSYTMNYIGNDEIGKLDEVVEDKGVKVIVDANAVMFVAGTEMDYVENETGSEFTFENPNKKSECGCGQSFNV